MKASNPLAASQLPVGERGAFDVVPPSAARSRNMAAVKRTNTAPEIQLRRALHAAGFRYRVDYPIRIDGRLLRPDIAFTRSRVAVFVDGCFWHSCPRHGQIPATNTEFWTAKLEANAERDCRQNQLLTDAGWLVVRLWEHEFVDVGLTTVIAAVASRRASGEQPPGAVRQNVGITVGP
jgi:DNA mismatch endonuclease, patch repair protein